MRILEGADGDGVIDLGDAMRLEHFDGRNKCRMILRKEETACRITVETMHGFERGDLFLFAQDGFDGLWVVTAHEARGLICDEIIIVLPKDADVAFFFFLGRGRFCWGGLFDGALDDGFWDFDCVACIEAVAGDPDTGAVDPHVAPINHGLGRAPRQIETRGEEVLQELCIILADGQGSDPRGMFGSAAHV